MGILRSVMMALVRKKVTLRLSDTSRRGWRRACTKYGVNFTALTEAIGLELAERDITSEQWERAVERAREIQDERGER